MHTICFDTSLKSCHHNSYFLHYSRNPKGGKQMKCMWGILDLMDTRKLNQSV